MPLCSSVISQSDGASTVVPQTLCLAGATASGKTAVAQLLAERLGAAILSADAMLVYQGMDIGTAKPTVAERGQVPYYGLDVVTPGEPFSAAAWLEEAHRAQAVSPRLIAVGGTGLYFSALLRGLDPTPPANPALRASLEALPAEELRARLAAHGQTVADTENPRRLVRALEILGQGGTLPAGWGERARPRLVALTWPREVLHRRIAERVDAMYAAGLLGEAEALRRRWPAWSRTAAQAIGYAEAFAVLDGTLTKAAARERTVVRTRQLARRQETYLRHQFDVDWVQAAPDDAVETLAGRVAEKWGVPWAK